MKYVTILRISVFLIVASGYSRAAGGWAGCCGSVDDVNEGEGVSFSQHLFSTGTDVIDGKKHAEAVKKGLREKQKRLDALNQKLCEAVEKNKSETVIKCLKAGANPNLTYRGSSLLVYALRCSKSEAVIYALVFYGATPTYSRFDMTERYVSTALTAIDKALADRRKLST